jgi:prepilin-type N-terminal cleavage/methylation domain-containing protein
MKKSGFTLLELSIVLVIIGLVVGGVVVGQSLVEQARINRINRDFQQYHAAFQAFRLKYRAFPGDFKDAYDYWSTQMSCSDDVADLSPPPPASGHGCNGDGNDIVDLAPEAFKAWQHLSLAGIIAGSYNGDYYYAGAGSAYQIYPGLNAPAGGLEGSAYLPEWDGLWFGVPTQAGYILSVGRFRPGDNTFNRAGLFNANEAYAFDSKYDDGRARTGKIGGLNANVDSNYNAFNPVTEFCANSSVYNIGYEAKRTCRILSRP